MQTRILDKAVPGEGGGGGGEEDLQFSLGVGKEILRPLSVGAIPHLPAMVCEKSAS